MKENFREVMGQNLGLEVYIVGIYRGCIQGNKEREITGRGEA